MARLCINFPQARRFLLRRLGLACAYADIAAVLQDLGFVQLDPINVCGRMHDLILRNRVVDYREGDLLRHVHPERGATRVAFEHYLPGRGILVALPMEFWPVIAAVTSDRRGAGRHGLPPRHLSASEGKLAGLILEALRERGPLTSDDIEHDGRAITAWGTPGRLVKHVLEAMFRRGEVLIAGRRDFRRVYDLPERVISPEVFSRPVPDFDAVRRAHVVATVRQRRLGVLTRAERECVSDLTCAVQVADGSEVHVLREDLPALDQAGAEHAEHDDFREVRLLAPLDPLIYHRSLTRRLWSFDYTWEVYTPPEKRVRGYYALPVLSGGEIVGDVEPRADRERRRLRVVSRRIRRGHVTRDAVAGLARFLGLRPPG